MADDLPATAGEITPAWLTAALGTAVSGVLARPLRQARAFSGGALMRVQIAGQGAPARLVAKLAPADATMRGRLAAANAREAAFYARVAPLTPHVPKAFTSAADRTGRSVILLPDLAGHRTWPLVEGARPEVAAAALASLASIHARWWGRPPMAASDISNEFSFAALWPAFRAGQGDLPSGLLALGDRLALGLSPAPAAPLTLTHGDAHLENMLIAPTGEAVWLDWQMAGAGAGAGDVCYFLTASLNPADRRARERDLVALWHEGLAAHGVTGYPLAQAWRDYLHGLAGKLLLTVIATMAFDNRGPARTAYRRADLARLAAFAADHLDRAGAPNNP